MMIGDNDEYDDDDEDDDDYPSHPLVFSIKWLFKTVNTVQEKEREEGG